MLILYYLIFSLFSVWFPAFNSFSLFWLRALCLCAFISTLSTYENDQPILSNLHISNCCMPCSHVEYSDAMFLCCFAQQSCNFCLQENATILLLSYILRQGNMQTAYLSSWCLKTEVGSCFFALLLFSDNMLATMCKLKLSNNLPDFCIFKSIFARINLKYRKNSSFLPFLVSLFRVLFWWRSPFPILKTKTTCSQPEAFSIGNLYFLCTTSSSWLQGFFLFSTEGMEGQLKNKHPVWLSLTDGENEISAVGIKIDLKIITTQDGPKWKLEWKKNWKSPPPWMDQNRH